MTLIVEDGSLVTDANTLVSRVDFIAYAASVGITIEDVDTTDVLLIKAMNFINSKENKLKGYKISRDQGVSYPRYGLKINGWAWDEDEIPTEAKICQMELALDLNSGTDLHNPAFIKGPRIQETVSGAVTVRYGTTSTIASRLSSKGFTLLNSLLKISGLQSISLVRV